MEERIVVVDDDAMILKHANRILTEAGFRVTCLKNGRLLMDYIAMNPVDLLLLDIRMPEMDGFEAICALRESASSPSVPSSVPSPSFTEESSLPLSSPPSPPSANNCSAFKLFSGILDRPIV